MLNNKILIIDDEQIVIDSIKASLKREDYNILSAGNGEEGMKIYKKETPLLIILDLRMPIMDGIEFLEHLKLTPSGQSFVIVLTGHGDDEEIEKCYKFGVSAFLRKPFNVFELTGIIKHCITLKHTQNELEKNEKLLAAANNELERKVEERTAKLEISLREKELLLKEVHHRVKNNLQVVISLLTMQAMKIKEQQYIDIFTDCKQRIESMALVHEKLYSSGDLSNIDFKEYINGLTSNLFHSYVIDVNRIKLNIEVDDVLVEIDTAIPCGLIINELLSNAMKYAFPDKTSGVITISFREIENDNLKLIVSDTGVGAPSNLDFENIETLGLNLVNGLVTRQLRGTLEMKIQNGTEFCIIFKRHT